MKYCVIIPAYNSERHIAAVLRDVLQYTNDIIVVNDGSTDRTLQAVEKFMEVGVDVVSYPRNRGKGYAIGKGFDRALARGFTHAVTTQGKRHCRVGRSCRRRPRRHYNRLAAVRQPRYAARQQVRQSVLELLVSHTDGYVVTRYTNGLSPLPAAQNE